MAPTPPTRASALSASRRTTLWAGLALVASALAELAGSSWTLVSTTTPTPSGTSWISTGLVLLAVVALAVGIGREPGIAARSRLAAAGLVVFPTATIAGALLTSSVSAPEGLGGIGMPRVTAVGVILQLLQAASAAGLITACVLVLVRRLLEPAARRALLVLTTLVVVFPFVGSAVVATAIALAAPGSAPWPWWLDLVVPAAQIALAVCLMIHGRGDDIRRRRRIVLDAW